ncbi:MAG: FAD-binding protein [Rubrivivax sp.]|nr:MAG: FAD-binding protein [Rubrivivax sp.]
MSLLGPSTRRAWLGSMALGLAGCHRPSSPGHGLSAQDSRLRLDVEGGWVGAHMDRGHAWRDGLNTPSSPPDQIRRVHTLIVGAGVAGLSAARGLQQAGLDDFAVLDLEDEAGGNARGHSIHGLPCPLGAHYLPMPGPAATEVAQWLEEIGLIRQVNGRWQGDERHLCHSLQERLFMPGQAKASVPGVLTGHWQEGLLPMPSDTEPKSAATRAQYQRFAEEVAKAAAQWPFTMPTSRAPWHPGLDALDRQTFAQWLDSRGFDSADLRWYLDYACRDDYGAGLGQVSAWAGLQYFASRHGFDAPGQGGEPHDAVLTWPEGNAFLTRRLAQGLGDRWHAGHVATRIRPGRYKVQVDALDTRSSRHVQWVAKQVIVAVPLFIAARLIDPIPPALKALAPSLRYAPWLVSNLWLKAPLQDRPGAPLAWDNVNQGSLGGANLKEPALGYVDARHQSLAPTPGPMLLTHYWALGGQTHQALLDNRQRLAHQPWQAWAQAVLDDLAPVHPDLPRQLGRIDLMRWGHAMIVPTPGLRGHPALAALAQPQGRLHFAHSDLSAYSVFEEAFTRGAWAALAVKQAPG